jgi:hypothetical protein
VQKLHHYCLFLQRVSIFVDYRLDESYTPNKIAIRVGTTFHDLQVSTSKAILKFSNTSLKQKYRIANKAFGSRRAGRVGGYRNYK